MPTTARKAATAVALALGVAALGAPQTARELALKHYQQALADRQRLDADAAADVAAYQRVIDAFRRVYLASPQSSRADDSLLAVAELYAKMGARFGAEPYRAKAMDAYRFLLREYPYSPLGESARKALEMLEASSRPASPEPPKQGLRQVRDVRHTSSDGLTRVIVELEAEVKPRGERLWDPDRFYFDLPEMSPGPALKNKTIPVGDALLKQVRVAETQIGVTRVVLDLNPGVEAALSTEGNPPRVAVELRKKAAGTALATAPALPAPGPVLGPPVPPPPPPKAAQANSRGERTLIRALGLKIGRVVIDPGHGGHDTGTIGPAGLMEKELALDVATRLAALIAERLGSEVILTRTDDSFVGLDERTELANDKQADLFLSIHANSSRLKTARGAETYYLNLTGDREALEVAARENAAANKTIHELETLVSKITLTEKVSESREFAAQVQRALYGALTVRNRGVRKAPFVVLIGARMPSVLAEISFLSNPRDEKLLQTPAYRQKVAEALFSGLASYARTLSRLEVAVR